MGKAKRRRVSEYSSDSSSSSEDEETLRLRLKVKQLKKLLKRKKVPATCYSSDSHIEGDNDNDGAASLSDNDLGEDITTTQIGTGVLQDPLHIEQDPSLRKHVLYILGQEDIKSVTTADSIHKDVASQWEGLLTTGLQEDIRKSLIEKYPPPANCLSLFPPKLNPEAKVASSEPSQKRDERLQTVQLQVAASLAAVGKLLTHLLQIEEQVEGKNLELIGLAGDACRLLSDLHYQQSETRRHLLSGHFNKDLREVILQSKRDELLFGADLGERIRSAKAMEKSGLELKPQKVKSFSPVKVRQPSENFRAPPRRSGSSTRPGGKASNTYPKFQNRGYKSGSTYRKPAETKGRYRPSYKRKA